MILLNFWNMNLYWCIFPIYNYQKWTLHLLSFRTNIDFYGAQLNSSLSSNWWHPLRLFLLIFRDKNKYICFVCVCVWSRIVHTNEVIGLTVMCLSSMRREFTVMYHRCSFCFIQLASNYIPNVFWKPKAKLGRFG